MYQWTAVKNQPAPDAALEMAGKTLHLADFQGQVVVLNLWATWCPPCIKELPTLDRLEVAEEAKGVVVIALSVDDMGWDKLRAYTDKAGLKLPHLARDSSKKFVMTLGSEGVPVTYLIDRQGQLRYRFDGSTDWMQPAQRQKIAALLAEGKGI